MRAHSTLSPRVLRNIHNRRSFCWYISYHLLNYIFKRLREEALTSLTTMSVPKDIITLLLKQLVVRISDDCLLEWRIACVHDEKYNSCSKNIGLSTVIMFCGDFRCHVTFGTQFSMQYSSAIVASNKAGKAKICNFEKV